MAGHTFLAEQPGARPLTLPDGAPPGIRADKYWLGQAAAAVGVESEVLPGSQVHDVIFADTREEILRLQREDPTLFETGGEKGGAYSGEAFRQELKRGLDPASPYHRQVRALPWGSGSGFVRSGADRGFVFCARVADHEAAQYRYVSYPEDGIPKVDSETLVCFSQAQVHADTERVLDSESHHLAYDAWEMARRHIFEEWQKATDPFNLQPKVPKAMRDAAALLRSHPPEDIPQEELERLIDAVEAPYGARIERALRGALRSSDDPARQAVAVAEEVKRLGLSPSPAPEPLPLIEIEDVHLVCWLAIMPEGKKG